jgi:hypothetical protein
MKFIVCSLMIAIHCSTLFGQGFSGYAGLMPSVILTSPGEELRWQTLLHNRLNFARQFSEHWSIEAGMRNRFITGDRDMIDPDGTGFDPAWADLSWNWAQGNHLVGNTAFDRLLVTFELNKWKMQLGRQRINWGQTFVWNPNDIFNTYSFFDFDYPERPGCDALRATFFHSETASSELAASIDRNGKTTVAMLHHRTWKGIDCQFIAGEQMQTDLVLGAALTGDLKGLNLRGEFSWFHPLRASDTGSVAALSLGADYVFPNSLTIQTEVLYNKAEKSASAGGLMSLYSAPLSAKRLSVCDYSVFAQASMPVTPRLNVALSGMYFVDIESFYAGLSIDVSLAGNWDMSLVGQFFHTPASPESDAVQFTMGFARLKYSF